MRDKIREILVKIVCLYVPNNGVYSDKQIDTALDEIMKVVEEQRPHHPFCNYPNRKIGECNCEVIMKAERVKLEQENKKLREGLQYIVSHSWATSNKEQAFKWINEFVDIAQNCLKEG